MKSRLRLVTYNIHRCVGRDGQFSPKRISDILQSLDADIIALQELETHADMGLDILQHFARCTGLHPVSGPTLFNERGHYGNALLLPSQKVTNLKLDVSFPHREPRGLICSEFHHKGQWFRVIATHFGLRRQERMLQCQRVLELLKDLKQTSSKPFCNVVMGDLNEWWPWSGTLRRLACDFAGARLIRTFPSSYPLFALDRILCEPGWGEIEYRAWDNPQTRIASDHLPLVADIKLNLSAS
ncbi:MAG: endonuclease [Ketobacter sp.]|nr:MAG: endonuclease [Ketobacter sp.]